MKDASLGPILTNMSADLMDVFGQDSRRREQSRELEIYVQNVNAVMPGLVTAAELIASTVRFLYFNRSNLAMKSTLYMLPHEELEVDETKNNYTGNPFIKSPRIKLIRCIKSFQYGSERCCICTCILSSVKFIRLLSYLPFGQIATFYPVSSETFLRRDRVNLN